MILSTSRIVPLTSKRNTAESGETVINEDMKTARVKQKRKMKTLFVF